VRDIFFNEGWTDFKNRWPAVTGPNSESMARIAYATSVVASRPKFFTTVKNGSLKISAKNSKFVKTF